MVATPKQPRARYPREVKEAVDARTAIDYAMHGVGPYQRCARVFIRNHARWIVPELIANGAGRVAVVEEEIQFDPVWSVEYAERVIGGRFEQAEWCIACNAVQSVEYSIRVLRGRFHAGEAAIAGIARTSLRYACFLRARFPLGESSLVQDDGSFRKYLLEVVRKRDEALEAVVCVNGFAAVTYAAVIVRGRWPEAEAAIAAQPAYLYRYARDVVRGKLPDKLQRAMNAFGIAGEDPDSVRAYNEMLEARGL